MVPKTLTVIFDRSTRFVDSLYKLTDPLIFALVAVAGLSSLLLQEVMNKIKIKLQDKGNNFIVFTS
jgi:hypothetical protein